MDKTKEIERLRALDSYSILDTMPDSDYDELTKLAAKICSTPVALITLIDRDRQWSKSHYGIGAEETPLEYSFCAHAIEQGKEVFYIRDAREDRRFSTNPLVTGEPYVAFYAGVPLLTPEGEALGTLCVIDRVPRDLTEDQLSALRTLSNQALKLLDLRKHKHHLKMANDRLERRNKILERFAEVVASQINSPLMIIWQSAEQLIRGWGKQIPEVTEVFKPIQASAIKLMDLVDGLLYHAKHLGEPELEKEEIAIDELVEELEGLFPTTNERQLDFFFRMRFIRANYKIREIFRELVSNGIRHNDKPKAQIEIGGSEDSKYYDFFVSDNGAGMTPSTLLRAFEMFTVIKPMGRYGEYSLGMGLSQVKETVHQLGGMIDIDSEEGEGTIVTFSLPK